MIILVIIIAFMIHREKFNENDSDPGCVCAFDLDGTITCGIDRAAKAITRCKELGCKIAINTARPTKWYHDLDLHGLGLVDHDFDSDFYNGEPFKCSFIDTKCLENSIADTKVKHLHTLATKWNVNPQRVILFDDQFSNVERAKQAGFSAIRANNKECGLPDDVVQQIDSLLSS
jgi:beta-phosphoglucomutase-like phosphatase (HAD superfamily)